MQVNEELAGEGAGRNVLWAFGNAEFDESKMELRVGGLAAELDLKSTEVLLMLLRHAGEVVSKEEIFASVWAGRVTVEGVLTNAVSRLRRALGDEAQEIISTTHRVGYRLTVPVSRKTSGYSPSRLDLKAGDAVPGRAAWQLLRPLGGGGDGEVWLAIQAKTREQRAFKFAIDGVKLSSLKREATLYRLLSHALGEREDIARVLEWNFEAQPFFLEFEYGGEDLKVWAERVGGIGAIPLEQRLSLMADIAESVAAAHSVGVLHKDLKPANVLIRETPDGTVRVRLTDFGSSGLLSGDELEQFEITQLGFTATQSMSGGRSGTPVYYAPELLSGQMPTVQSDVYALGVMLYQLVVGDLQRPLAAGWEADISDPTLREDISSAANGSPLRRMPSAAELAIRLRDIEQRRVSRQAEEARRKQMQEAQRALERSQLRRPLWIATIVILAAGLLTSSWLYLQTRQALDAAERQKQVTRAINAFLSQDLIGTANPLGSGNKDVTVMQAVDKAAGKIDSRLSKSPLIAAELHRAIGEAYNNLGTYDAAEREFAAAEKLFSSAQVADPESAKAMQIAQMLNRGRQGNTEEALTAIDSMLSTAGNVESTTPLLVTRMHCAKSELLQLAQRISGAAAQFLHCIEGLEALRSQDPEQFLELQGLYYQQRASYTYSLNRQGENEKALEQTKMLLEEMQRVLGDENPRTLAVQTTLGAIYGDINKLDEAIDVLKAVPEKVARQLGKQHGAYGRVITILGDIYSYRGDHDKAIALYQEASRIFDIGFHGKHPYAMVAVQGLSTVYNAAGKDRESIDASIHALTLVKANYGEGAAIEHQLRYDIADSLLKIGQPKEAKAYVDSLSQEKLEEIMPAKNWTGRLSLLRGRQLLQQGDFDGARTQVSTALSAFEKKADGHLLERAKMFLERAESKQTLQEGPIWSAAF